MLCIISGIRIGNMKILRCEAYETEGIVEVEQ